MKRSFTLALLLVTGLFFAGCADTNDRGVIVSKPYDIFGAAANRAPVAAPANPSPANSDV